MTPLPSDHAARQQLITARTKLYTLSRRIDAALVEHDRLIGLPGYPAAGRAFDRAYADMARAAYAVFELDGLLETAAEYDPPAPLDERQPASIDERFGLCSWVAGAPLQAGCR